MSSPSSVLVRIVLVALALIVLSAPASRAGVITAWDFSTAVSGSGSTTVGDADDISPTSINFQTGATALTRGSGFTANPLQAFAGPGAVNTYNSYSPASLADAVTSNFYLQFSSSPDAGNQLALSSLEFAAYQQNAHPSATVTVEYDLGSGYSLAGSATPISPNWVGGFNSVDLSGIPALQHVTGTVSFRLYFFGFAAYEDRGLGQVAGSDTDLGLNGTVSLAPEPSASVIGLTGCLVALRRRAHGARNQR